MTRYFDTHCHLQDERFGQSRSAVIARAKTAGVAGFLCCGTTETDWHSVESLAHSEPSVVCGFGLHPWYCAGRSAQWLDKLDEILVRNSLAVMGEIGLDHALDSSTYAEQESVFKDQFALACKLGRPVSIHCRKAFGRLIDIVSSIGEAKDCIVHSYSGPPDLVKRLQDLGFCLSFSGSLTYPKSLRAKASAALVDPSRLLVETDSPDIKPYLCQTLINEPANIVVVANELSRIRNMPLEEISILTWENARRTLRQAQGT